MKAVFVPVAGVTARDLIRRRVFIILALFAGLLILLSFPLRQLTIGQWARIITDVGFGATELSTTALAILLGATLIAGDLERRTLYPLLTKPIGRSSFVTGKFIGLALILIALTLVMALGVVAMLVLAHPDSYVDKAALVQVTAAIALHACVCGAIALMFSCFTSTTLAATFGLSLWFLGHTVGSLVYFAKKSGTPSAKVVVLVARLLPDLEKLNLKSQATHAQAIPWNDLGIRATYGIAYAVAAVSLGAAVFSRRDLK